MAIERIQIVEAMPLEDGTSVVVEFGGQRIDYFASAALIETMQTLNWNMTGEPHDS